MSTQTRNPEIFRLGDLPRNVVGKVTDLPKDAVKRSREVWLAGVGALATVEEEGTSFFSTLVQRGEKVEDQGRKQIDAVREDVAARQKQVTERVENTVHEPLIGAMKRFGVPTRAEVQELSANVDALANRVNALITRLDERATTGGAPRTESMQTIYAVVPREEGWAVEKEGIERAVSVHATKDEAVEAARGLAHKSEPSRLHVHKRDGTVQDTFTYGG